MWEYNYYSYDELYHYGIKGMKWGIRRTAAQLGHYVRSKKTARKRKAALEKARKTKVANKKAAEKRQELLDKGLLSPKKMTDKELADRIKRLESEKKLKDLVAQTETVDLGKKYTKDFLDKAIMPALQESTKKVLTDYLSKNLKTKFGLDTVDEGAKYLENLQKSVNQLNLEKQYKNLTKPDNTYVDELATSVKKLTLEKQKKKLEAEAKAEAEAEKKKKKEESDKE